MTDELRPDAAVEPQLQEHTQSDAQSNQPNEGAEHSEPKAEHSDLKAEHSTESAKSLESAETPEAIGFPVGNAKFWTMSILTFGVYTMCWAYKNFQAMKVPSDQHLMHVVYAWFLPLSFHKLMESFENRTQGTECPLTFMKVPLAVLFFLLNVATKGLDKMGSEWSLATTLGTIIVAAIVQRAVLRANKKLAPTATIDTKPNRWDFTLIILVWGWAFVAP